MRWFRLVPVVAVAVVACGGGAGPTPTVDAKLEVIDGVILYPDAMPIDAVDATTGAIDLTIQCAGSGCGKSGFLKLVVDDCNGGVPVASKLQPGKTLTAGVDLHTTFDLLPPAMDCVSGFLSQSGASTPKTGDVIASGGAVHVTVVVGQVATATLVLDTIQP